MDPTSHKFARSDIVTQQRSLKTYYRISRQSREADHRQLAPLYRRRLTLTALNTTVKSPSTLKPLVNGLPRKRTTVVEFYEWSR